MSEAPSHDMPAILLVHGSWHGPWCWDRLVPELARRGVIALTVALPSVGNDPSRLGGLQDDARAVTAAAAANPGPLVVLGHSYGGAAVSAAVFGPNVRRLVFLGAFMPDSGRAFTSYLPEGPLPPYVGLRDDGTSAVPAGQAAPCFYADCDAATTAWAEERLRPQSQAILGAVTPAAAWRSIASTYVVLTEDRAIPPDLQRLFAGQADAVTDFVSSHSPFLSRPGELADLLVKICLDTLAPEATVRA
jgi:pimeloyl-ACP methyl ester carboxylesterase